MKPSLNLCCLAILLTFLVLNSCETEKHELAKSHLELPEAPFVYEIDGASGYVATLGRVLFYDKNLSINNSVSCASCHKQVLGFSDNVAHSKGFENILTARNSMPIQNLRGDFGFLSLFWDGREQNVQSMVLRPITNHVEMGVGDFDKLTEKLESIPYYQELFLKAYGDTDITTEEVSTALTLFLLNIRSTETKFDKARAGQASLNALEVQGQHLFFETYDCNSCHQVESPTGYIQAGTFANIGLDKVYEDPGLGGVTNNPADVGKFKIPSLRNVLLTAPYMHDGRFATLEEVLDFYSDGISNHDNLDHRLRDSHGSAMKFSIPDQDQKAIIAFLNTLTDEHVIGDPKLSNPFKTK